MVDKCTCHKVSDRTSGIDFVAEISKLKREKNAVILAHYYTRPEVQEVADFIGDSLVLSEKAASTDADIIVFAGVHFMGETAKVLSPDKKVIMPDMDAGCSLAESCHESDFAEFKKKYPDHMVVSYVNTTVGVKAMTDICCTSSNALRIVESIPKEKGLIFAPDRNLGDYIKRVTGRENMVIWNGACHVHEKFSVEKILKLKKEHPQAKVITHPECKAPVILISDFVGSTAALIEYTKKDDAKEYIVVTESGVLYEMQRVNPGKIFIPAPPEDTECGCNDCEFMKMVTLEKIYCSLKNETPEIVIPEEIRSRAEGAIRKMLELSK